MSTRLLFLANCQSDDSKEIRGEFRKNRKCNVRQHFISECLYFPSLIPCGNKKRKLGTVYCVHATGSCNALDMGAEGASDIPPALRMCRRSREEGPQAAQGCSGKGSGGPKSLGLLYCDDGNYDKVLPADEELFCGPLSRKAMTSTKRIDSSKCTTGCGYEPISDQLWDLLICLKASEIPSLELAEDSTPFGST
ncbi:hypothetical protein MJG53_017627 [Ovis ammon polii x Ovis aries]|uniref:Uncharacterized protein n=1 Tax=Ovis ammon polii x Ovis aries TaxID=2918886 RepID=A0ACB9U8X2_9CETA|nr:hypothetical protein MJG53_017627 [Ovis ammon polii x Ovis aries]